ncbi:MAG: RpiB/LacA/LacB family sugar-phosphate isomerase [Thermoplasmata archaeon]|nr:RpiB/LacA/LacB family sugar-phosphate isomerase [Thermoplasmata archaeon]
MRVALGADHGGFTLKEKIVSYLKEKNHRVLDVSAELLLPKDDYPEYSFRAAEAVVRGECDTAILFCMTGTGMAIAANKVPGIRAAVCLNPEMAKMARAHNHANVLSLAGKYTRPKEAIKIVEAWLATRPSRAARHVGRVAKMNNYRLKSKRKTPRRRK